MAIFQRFLVWAIPVYRLESLEFQRFVLFATFVWTIPVYAILTKGNSVGVCHMLCYECPRWNGQPPQRVTLNRLVTITAADN